MAIGPPVGKPTQNNERQPLSKNMEAPVQFKTSDSNRMQSSQQTGKQKV